MRISDWSSDVCSSDLFQLADGKYGNPGQQKNHNISCGDDTGVAHEKLKKERGWNQCTPHEVRRRGGYRGAEVRTELLRCNGNECRPVANGNPHEIGRTSCRDRVCQSG